MLGIVLKRQYVTYLAVKEDGPVHDLTLPIQAAHLKKLEAQALPLYALMYKEVQHTHWLQLDVCSLMNDKELLPASLEATQDLETAKACMSRPGQR